MASFVLTDGRVITFENMSRTSGNPRVWTVWNPSLICNSLVIHQWGAIPGEWPRDIVGVSEHFNDECKALFNLIKRRGNSTECC